MKLSKRFSAVLQTSPNKGGWTYVVWPASVKFFGTHGLVRFVEKSMVIHSKVLSWQWVTGDTCCLLRQQFGMLSVNSPVTG